MSEQYERSSARSLEDIARAMKVMAEFTKEIAERQRSGLDGVTAALREIADVLKEAEISSATPPTRGVDPIRDVKSKQESAAETSASGGPETVG